MAGLVLRFDKPMGTRSRLVALANDPAFRASLGVLPTQGLVTKPALTSTAGSLYVGAASVLFGSDRKADGELADFWDALKWDLHRAQIPVPDEALTTQQFRDYRERYMGEPQVAAWREVLQELWLGQARDVGLFPEYVQGATFLNPSSLQTIYADGTFFRAASEVGKSAEALAKSRARVVEPFDVFEDCLGELIRPGNLGGSRVWKDESHVKGSNTRETDHASVLER